MRPGRDEYGNWRDVDALPDALKALHKKQMRAIRLEREEAERHKPLDKVKKRRRRSQK